ncbi:hypothetical protein LZ318_18965 [Saccharopolyspora indica]|uniref:hypothetical protein n=1 Tax=Saccharopolyspora indica TaxID=1229659 RepID=UPI0022EA2DC9|nr:hypothetical protein [Saccharopolyspora indica]MDA3645433.1 hypothetical protein [Saccharopolyspora indica]
MLSKRILRGVAAGEISEAYLRWPSQLAEAGTRLSTAVGLIGVGEVSRVDPEQLTDDDARRAGFGSAAGLRASLAKRGRGEVYRLALTFEGPGRPVAEAVVLGGRERAVIDQQLARLDVSAPRGPWTRQVLEVLRRQPGIRAGELAVERNRPASRCKSDVWQLRELGLVEPVGVGFGLSARGRSYLEGGD